MLHRSDRKLASFRYRARTWLLPDRALWFTQSNCRMLLHGGVTPLVDAEISGVDIEGSEGDPPSSIHRAASVTGPSSKKGEGDEHSTRGRFGFHRPWDFHCGVCSSRSAWSMFGPADLGRA